MKRSFAVPAVALAMGASSSTDRTLYALEPIDQFAVACGCSFNESIPDAEEGGYGAGPRILVLDPNGNPPNALVNLGKGNVKLRPENPISWPLFKCAAGEKWSSVWLSEEVEVKAELIALKPGEEACWFTGNVSATHDSAEWSVAVKGACGC